MTGFSSQAPAAAATRAIGRSVPTMTIASTSVPFTSMMPGIIEVNGTDVDAIVIVGTDLPMARVAAAAGAWLEKPVIALNTASYWHALRANGITDQVYGFGRLLSDF